ncbi:MAG: EAL domain-containing protein [Janthinobacterium lividum]
MSAASTHPTPTGTTPVEVAELDRVLRVGLRVLFQPVVDLSSGETIAFEALARGPLDSAFASAEELSGAAIAAERVAELDHAYQQNALDEAALHRLHAPWTLFLGTETKNPETKSRDTTTSVPRLPPADTSRCRVVVELSERALSAHPAEVMHLVDLVRARGWGIALGDVGADPGSTALLPLVRPDVITLDPRLLRAHHDASDVAAIANAVSAQAERDASIVLADGVETEADLHTALALGATLGRGRFFGGPAPLAGQLLATPAPRREVLIVPRAGLGGADTPFSSVEAHLERRRGGADLVEEMTRHLELQALRGREPCLVVATVPATLDPPRQDRLSQLSETAEFLATFGGDTRVRLPGPHVTLDAGDPMREEIVTAVLGPYFTGAVLARPVAGTDQFDVVVSHTRHLVVGVVARLLNRMLTRRPAPPPTPAASRMSAEVVPDPERDGVDAVRWSGHARLGLALQNAFEADRLVGTGTGLLLVAGASSTSAVRRMRSAVRARDQWIPLGDALHAVLLTGLPRAGTEGAVDRAADALLHAVESAPGGLGAGVRISIGASLAPTRAVTADEALHQAQEALAEAGRAGGHCARIWPV